jgi:hypothetical protein
LEYEVKRLISLNAEEKELIQGERIEKWMFYHWNPVFMWWNVCKSTGTLTLDFEGLTPMFPLSTSICNAFLH